MEAITRASAMVLCVALLTACGSGPGEGGTGTGAGSAQTSVAPPAVGSVSTPGTTGQTGQTGTTGTTGALTEEELARLERIVSGAEDAAAQVEREAGTDTGIRP